MVIGFRNAEWLAHNADRNYPLAIDASGVDTTNSFTLPEDFIVSLYLPVPWANIIQTNKFFISEIGVFATGYSIKIGYDGQDGTVDVAYALIPRSTHETNNSYVLGGVGEFEDSRGTITIGKLSGIDEQPSGIFTFDLEATRLDPDAIRPNIRSVSSIQVQNGTARSEKLYGRIVLRAARNMQITPILAEGEDPIIEFSAISGAGLDTACECDDAAAEPVRTINGITADDENNFTILGDDCFEIEEIEHGIKIRDVCSKPCCSCTELEILNQALQSFGEKATTLENYLVSLEQRVTQMDQIVLGAKLGDRGCNTGCG